MCMEACICAYWSDPALVGAFTDEESENGWNWVASSGFCWYLNTSFYCGTIVFASRGSTDS